MKEFTVLTTYTKGYNEDHDEGLSGDFFFVLVPSRNTRMIQRVGELMLDFVIAGNMAEFGDYDINFQITEHDEPLNGQEFRDGIIPYIKKQASAYWHDGASYLHSYLLSYPLELTPNEQSDPIPLYDYLSEGFSCLTYQGDNGLSEFTTLLRNSGFDIVGRVAGLITSCNPPYEYESEYDCTPVIQKLSRSVLPLYDDLGRYQMGLATRLAKWAYGEGSEGAEEFYINFPDTDMSVKKLITPRQSGYVTSAPLSSRYSFDNDNDGARGFVTLAKIPIIGKLQ